MLARTIVFLTALFSFTQALGQTRTLTGKVIDEEFKPLPQVWISNADTILLSKTDIDGNFSAIIPLDTKILIVSTIGMEWKSIVLLSECKHLDIILQLSSTYDFMSPAKVDRKRKRHFNKLPLLHQSAFAKGIFKSQSPCYDDRFIAEKKKKKERHKAWKQNHRS